MLIVDEAAHVPKTLFTNVIFPILRVGNSSAIFLSSPDGETNHFSRWMQIKGSDGKPQMKVIYAVLICDACRSKDLEEAIQCTHVKHNAHWINERKANRVKAYYEGDAAMIAQELGGMVVSTILRAFYGPHVDRVFSNDRVMNIGTPSFIAIAADNQGGGSSHLALTSGYFDSLGRFVVRFPFSFYS